MCNRPAEHSIHRGHVSPEADRDELAQIDRRRGLSAELAERVELSRLGRLTIHVRDELGIDVSVRRAHVWAERRRGALRCAC